MYKQAWKITVFFVFARKDYISVGSDHRGGMEFGAEMETDIEFYDPDDPESSMVTGPEFSVGVQSVMEVFSLSTTTTSNSSDDEPILFARGIFLVWGN